MTEEMPREHQEVSSEKAQEVLDKIAVAESVLREAEKIREITHEEMKEMLDQVPILEDMLRGWETELEVLRNQHVPNALEIIPLEQKINELSEEIQMRKEIAGEQDE